MNMKKLLIINAIAILVLIPKTYADGIFLDFSDADGSYTGTNAPYTGTGTWTTIGNATTNGISFDGLTLDLGRADSGTNVSISAIQIVAIPEPSTFALLGIALGSLLLFRRKF
jgi:hypothetical protein